MEKGSQEMIYCGEIIDRSWFDDPEAYDEGTYEPISVYWSGENIQVMNDEFYQAVLRPNRIYLDDYPEQEKLRKEWFIWHKEYWLKKHKQIAKLIGSPFISDKPVLSIFECIPEPKCILLSEHYGVCEHYIKRFLRRD